MRGLLDYLQRMNGLTNDPVFHQWIAGQALRGNLGLGDAVNAGTPQSDYDLHGYYMYGNQPTEAHGNAVHYTDQFKYPNEPTFSDQSQYASGQPTAGSWYQTGLGNQNYAVYKPSNYAAVVNGTQPSVETWQSQGGQ